MQEAALFLVRTLLNLYLLIFLLRFLLQLVRADFYNPLAQFAMRVTNPLVQPARRIIPGLAGVDLATLCVLILLEFAATAILLALLSQPLGWQPILAWGLLRFVNLVLWFYFLSIFVYAILSWTGQQGRHPLTSVLNSLNQPILGPVRRVVPLVGGIDISVLIVLVLIQAALIALPLPRILA